MTATPITFDIDRSRSASRLYVLILFADSLRSSGHLLPAIEDEGRLGHFFFCEEGHVLTYAFTLDKQLVIALRYGEQQAAFAHRTHKSVRSESILDILPAHAWGRERGHQPLIECSHGALHYFQCLLCIAREVE